MATRRTFLQGGLGALTIGLLRRYGFALAPARALHGSGIGVDPASAFGAVPLHPSSVVIDGMPFAPGFLGDDFPNDAIPFHQQENVFPGGKPPDPTESVPLAVVGGGISGLTTAFLLKRHRPVVFELHPRFGGTTQGENWAGALYSMGGAYVITPDAGYFLDRFYRQLGLHRVKRLNAGGSDPIELNGEILEDFWSGAFSPTETAAFERYREIVTAMAEKNYPEIPLPEGKDNGWILDLDRRTLREDIEAQMGMKVPPLLAAAIQGYCYSSFAAGWEEVSAAGGWNFLAAEEYGRWVFPGGNAWMVEALRRRLARVERADGHQEPRRMLRPGRLVVDVRLAPAGRVQVTWREPNGDVRSLLARRVVMACSKHICKFMLPELAQLDPVKFDAMQQIQTRAYVVANVLLDAPVSTPLYDIFLLEDGNFPMDEGSAELQSRVIDLLNGSYAQGGALPRSVLTLYWPLPFARGRFSLIADNGFQDYATRLAPQIRRMLDLIGVKHNRVRQVRMTRWGHAMPIARPGLIANGVVDDLRRPFADRVYFVNQDNWALPAVENSVLDAAAFAPEISAAIQASPAKSGR